MFVLSPAQVAAGLFLVVVSASQVQPVIGHCSSTVALNYDWVSLAGLHAHSSGSLLVTMLAAKGEHRDVYMNVCLPVITLAPWLSPQTPGLYINGAMPQQLQSSLPCCATKRVTYGRLVTSHKQQLWHDLWLVPAPVALMPTQPPAYKSASR